MVGVLAELEDAGLVTPASRGCQGCTYAKIPYKAGSAPPDRNGDHRAA
ncbi:MAG TPA: hypothetical protein VKU39_21590 [Streptosporangiaceae bacterium]|nr:hypothetical protein [Streptosporangiaceae bacterium]